MMGEGEGQLDSEREVRSESCRTDGVGDDGDVGHVERRREGRWGEVW